MKKKKNYVNNEELLQEIKNFFMTDIISEELHMMFWKMSKNIISRPRFNRYTPEWKEDILTSGYLKCICVLKKKRYDYNRPNPFSYFTTVITNCFLDTINLENKQFEIKKKLIDIYIDDQKKEGIIYEKQQ